MDNVNIEKEKRSYVSYMLSSRIAESYALAKYVGNNNIEKENKMILFSGDDSSFSIFSIAIELWEYIVETDCLEKSVSDLELIDYLKKEYPNVFGVNFSVTKKFVDDLMDAVFMPNNLYTILSNGETYYYKPFKREYTDDDCEYFIKPLKPALDYQYLQNIQPDDIDDAMTKETIILNLIKSGRYSEATTRIKNLATFLSTQTKEFEELINSFMYEPEVIKNINVYLTLQESIRKFTQNQETVKKWQNAIEIRVDTNNEEDLLRKEELQTFVSTYLRRRNIFLSTFRKVGEAYEKAKSAYYQATISNQKYKSSISMLNYVKSHPTDEAINKLCSFIEAFFFKPVNAFSPFAVIEKQQVINVKELTKNALALDESELIEERNNQDKVLQEKMFEEYSKKFFSFLPLYEKKAKSEEYSLREFLQFIYKYHEEDYKWLVSTPAFFQECLLHFYIAYNEKNDSSKLNCETNNLSYEVIGSTNKSFVVPICFNNGMNRYLKQIIVTEHLFKKGEIL